MVPEKISPVRLDVPENELKREAEKYVALALSQGATRASAVSASSVPVDERVQLKCCVPKCFGYGTSANCPPHTMKPEETRKLIERYRQAVVFQLEVPPPVIVRDKATITQRVEAYKKVFDLVSLIESAAFYDGYYLSCGFAAGSCKSTFCYDKPCTVLSGEKCKLQLRSRPSMEAVGIDCYRLATELGWTIYPIGSSATPQCIPHSALMGLVLVD